LAAALLVVAVAVGGLDREVLTEAGKSLGYRGQYWRSSLAMIADHPLMGCGPGNFQDAYQAYKLPEASEEIADPHNLLFEVWATAGTPAMLALVGVLAGFFVTVLRESRRTAFPGRPGRPGKAVLQVALQAVPPGEKQHPAFVYAGALAGFALVVPLGAISVAPPELGFFLVAIPCVVFSLGSLWSWVDRGEFSAGLTAIGVAVLLVDLCAAGGISFAGVAGSLWLLMAIGLSLTESSPDRRLPGWSALAALAATFGLAIACYATAYGPVLRSEAEIRLAQRHPLQAEEHLLAAAQADPLSAEPWNQLAAHAFAAWQVHPGVDLLRRFEAYSESSVRLAPNSSSIWRSTGDRYLEIYERTRDADSLKRAEEALRRAVQLYPNSAVNRARLATALRSLGDVSGYEAERNRALELDQLTPHLDKKLPDELRQFLQRN
jgi:hypothetical protein